MRMIQAEWEQPFEPVFHTAGFNFPQMPVITSEKPGKVQLYHWGLVPHIVLADGFFEWMEFKKKKYPH